MSDGTIRFYREGVSYRMTIDAGGATMSVQVSAVNAIFLAQQVVGAVTGAMLNAEVGKPKLSTKHSTDP